MDSTKCRKCFISSVRSEIAGTPKVKVDDLSSDEMKCIIDLAKKHEVLPIILNAFCKADNRFAKNKFVQNGILKSMGMYERQNNAVNKIRESFEREKIDFIFLKGSFVRSLYPEPYMRTSGDIDVLVKESDVDRATESLMQNPDFSVLFEKSKDIQVSYCGNVRVELHYRLVSESSEPNIKNILDKVWLYADKINAVSHEYVLTNEMLAFYHIAHMYKHFKYGGCGVRYFCDYYLIATKTDIDSSALVSMLEDAGTSEFASCVNRICKMWFEDALDEEMNEVADYVLSNGAFGDRTSMLESSCVQKGRLGYFFSRLFVPYTELSVYYPNVEGRKYLIPFYEIKFLVYRLTDRTRFIGTVNAYKKITYDRKKMKSILDTVGIDCK